MKNLFLILFVLAGTVAVAQKPAKLKVTYNFENIVEGYDHQTKTEVYVDNKLVATSKEHKQSEPTTISVATTRGMHNIKVVNYAYYNGQWEARSTDNGYSTDGTVTKDWLLKKKNALSVTYDLNQPDPVVK
ncbi:MAG: hypothetical protein K0R65_1548 [Crocinitomicaceae bacterium]|jgi:hypothetical protein|nr:hypothetical protein [Crocinitomicaceae bacterium]